MRKIISYLLILSILFVFNINIYANENEEFDEENIYEKKEKTSRSYNVSGEEFFGQGWRMRTDGIYNGWPTKNDRYFEESSLSETAIKIFITTIVSSAYWHTTSVAIGVAKIKYLAHLTKIRGNNGIFSKTYYLAKPINDSDQNIVGYPVPCRTKWVTIFYDDSSHRITKYITKEEKNTFNQVINWYEFRSPNASWNY